MEDPTIIEKIFAVIDAVINTVIEYAKNNPDKAKELIGKFTKIKPKAPTTDQTTMQGL